MFRCLDLIPMRLPADCGLRRRPVYCQADQHPDHDQMYDFDTLVYSATFLPAQNVIVLVCPLLLNLTALVRQGQFRSDLGHHRIKRHKRFRRHEEITLHATGNPGTLTLQTQGLAMTIAVVARDSTLDRQTVLMTLSKDNDLDWIAQWAAHYVARQGVEHLLIYDNASKGYCAQDLLNTLAAVPGLRGATVVSCDARYGARGTKRPAGRALFLQLGMLNTSRHRYVAAARAVIYADIDEVLVSQSGMLRDTAEGHFLKYTTAQACWRYANRAAGQRANFADHVLRQEPETFSKEKWCLVPGGPLRGRYWDSHGVGRYGFNWLCKSGLHKFYHCAHITTGWKGLGRQVPDADLVHDAQAARDLANMAASADRA